MRVYYDLQNLPAFRNAVITIGSFDGVHLGHQQLLARINRLARRCGGESVVVTFHPHPRQVVYPQDDTLRLLTTTAEKVDLFGRFGVDHVVVVPFTVEFSQLSADEYIEKFLVGKFHPRYIVIGYDHRFGLNRQGDINYLRWYGPKAGYEVVEIEPQEIDHIAVSSTKIRQALERADVAAARRLLGHPFPLTGKVVHGRRIGRGLGFPTANLEIGDPHKLIPPDGIYAVRVVLQEHTFGGMLYIGSRPSLEDAGGRTIEVNIFDFNETIYGETLRVELIDYIRADRAFANLDDLKAQMAIDQKTTLARLEQALPAVGTAVDLQTAIVILNYNGRDYLQRFLPTVEHSLPADVRIIVADNGSTDRSLEWLATHAPSIERIDLQRNYGFAEGYNRALAQVDAEVYVLLNSDVEVTPGWMEPCLRLLAEDETVAACQPKIRAFHQRNRFEYAGAAGGWMDALGYPFCRGRIFGETEEDQGQYDMRQEIFWASGAALFIRASLFHGIGGFEGEYFAHAEEIDLCWRLKRAGYRIVAVPESVVYHVGGGTLAYNTPRKTYLNFRNTLITSIKNEKPLKLLWWLPLRLVLDGVAGLLFLTQGKLRHIQSILRAHLSFYRRAGYWWRRRREADERIERLRIGPGREHTGRWADSIVLHYYLLGRRRFSELWERKRVELNH